MEKNSFKYEKYSYDYFLIREEDCKTISLSVQQDLSIKVKCPVGYSQKKIDDFLKKNMKKVVEYIIKLENINHKTV